MCISCQEFELEDLNRLLKDRGVEILKIFHPNKEYAKFIPNLSFMIKDCKDVKVDGVWTEVTIGYHGLNFLLDSRGVAWHKLKSPDTALFSNFTHGFTLPLRFTISYCGDLPNMGDGSEGFKIKRFTNFNFKDVK